VLLLLALAGLFLLPSPWGVVALVATAAVEVLEILFWKRFLRRYRLRVGPETMVGTRATVVEACAPLGQVRVRGELWRARARSPVHAGETVRVAAVEGLTLEVEPE
jgi:membrane-bound serine protease (ClpP class)